MMNAKAGAEPHILIVDDNATGRKLLVAILRAEGYRTSEASDGEDGLKLLEQENVDCIVSDILMPNMDGYRFCYELRKSEKHSRLPFILVSATYTSPNDAKLARKLGTDKVLKKPVSATEMVQVVREVLTDPVYKKPRRISHAETIEVIAQYRDALVAKLEEKAAELQRTTEDLRSSEELFRLITESAADLISVLDLQGRRLYNSPSYKAFFGDTEKMRGTDSFREIHPDDRERIKSIFRETVATGVGQRAEFKFILPDGSTRDIESQGSVVRDSDGRSAKVVVVSRDVTERMKAEVTLRNLSSAVEQAGDSIMITDKNGVIEYVNPAFEKTTGYSRGEAVGKTPRILKSGRQSQSYYEHLWQTILSGKQFRDVVINRKKDGTLFHEEHTVVPIVDSKAQIVHFVSTGRDITERKQAEERLRESERRFREMLENIELIALSLDRNGTVTFCNDYLLRLTGWEREEVIGRNWFDQFIPADNQDLKEVFAALLMNKPETLHHENEILTRSGERRFIRWNNSVQRSDSGDVVGVTSIGEDATDRKKAEGLQRALFRIAQAADSSKQLNDLFQAIHSIVKEVMTAENFFIALYDETNDLLSFPYFVDEVDKQSIPRKPGKGYTEYVLQTGKSFLCDDQTHRELARSGEVELIGALSPIWLGVPLIIEKKTIGVMAVQHYSNPHAYGEREKEILEYVSALVATVIERKRSEEALELAHDQLKSLHDNLNEALFSIDVVNNKMLQVSIAHETVFGYPTKEFYKNPRFWYDLIVPEDKSIADSSNSTLAEGKSAELQFRVLRRDGEIRWIEAKVKPTLDADGKLIRLDGIASDITTRRRADEALLQSEQRYRAIFEESKDGLFISTVSGKIVEINSSIMKIFGYDSREEVLKLSLADDIYVNPGDREELLRRLTKDGYVEDLEFPMKRKDGQRVRTLLSVTAIRDPEGKVVMLRGLVKDVTKQRQLELQLAQAQKMESLGTLAGGIAHDFNNILAIILGHASLMEKTNRDPSQQSRSIEAITKSTQRGAALVRQLLTFARKTDIILESVQINGVVSEVVKLLRETIPKVITISADLEESLPSTIADANQVHQVLLNLCVNARDAMLPQGGILSIATRTIEGESVRSQFPGARALEYAMLSVTDTGTGMDEATRMRIFEPFFTTKEKGKGTGLGLATVYGIVESHRGFIDVASKPGSGTTFLVYFPVLPREIEPPENEVSDVREIQGGKETILVVEDEDMLRELVTRVLERKGYHVITAVDGEEGIEVFSQRQNEINLVLTDLGLPKVGGETLIKALIEINPCVKIIVASGFVDPEVKAELFRAGALEFIQKPFKQGELFRKLRDALDRKARE